jgi:magnesium-transporting ATPase (P-type)
VALCDARLPVRKFPPGFSFNTSKINFPLSGFRMVGIMAMMDPPRASVPDSIAKCQAAGIKVIMSTGDHPSTAKAIAKSVGILSLDQDPQERTALLKPAQSCLISGEELKEMTSEELDHALMHHQGLISRNTASAEKFNGLLIISCNM